MFFTESVHTATLCVFRIAEQMMKPAAVRGGLCRFSQAALCLSPPPTGRWAAS